MIYAYCFTIQKTAISSITEVGCDCLFRVYHKLQLDGSEMLDKIFRKICGVSLYVACNCHRGSGSQYA
jgi:hypothetical protein